MRQESKSHTNKQADHASICSHGTATAANTTQPFIPTILSVHEVVKGHTMRPKHLKRTTNVMTMILPILMTRTGVVVMVYLIHVLAWV